MTEPSAPQSAFRLSMQNALIMAVFALLFTALMAGVYLWTQPAIARSVEAEKLRLINEVLPPSSYDNDLLKDVIALDASPELGLPKGSYIWRARKDGQDVALVLELSAKDGYGGPVQMVMAVYRDGTVGGVRVVSHKETPGLGDYIDPKKDRNKANPWINQFSGRSLTASGEDHWKLKKDQGQFDYMTGATISARAVTQAVGRALAFVNEKGDALYQP